MSRSNEPRKRRERGPNVISGDEWLKNGRPQRTHRVPTAPEKREGYMNVGERRRIKRLQCSLSFREVLWMAAQNEDHAVSIRSERKGRGIRQRGNEGSRSSLSTFVEVVYD